MFFVIQSVAMKCNLQWSYGRQFNIRVWCSYQCKW